MIGSNRPQKAPPEFKCDPIEGNLLKASGCMNVSADTSMCPSKHERPVGRNFIALSTQLKRKSTDRLNGTKGEILLMNLKRFLELYED